MTDKTEQRWLNLLLRDRFKAPLLKRLTQGDFITPEFFHKCTLPHGWHCFQTYVFRPRPFSRYMRKHHIPLAAAPARPLEKVDWCALSSACARRTAQHARRTAADAKLQNKPNPPAGHSPLTALPAAAYRWPLKRPQRKNKPKQTQPSIVNRQFSIAFAPG